MSNRWKLLIVIAAIVVLSILAGNSVLMAVLTLLTPVYAVLLASLFFLIFLIAAIVAVSIGQSYHARHERDLERKRAGEEAGYEEAQGRKAA